MRNSIIVLALIGFFIAACTSTTNTNSTNNSTQANVSAPPTSPGQNSTVQARQCTQTIPYQTLIAALPKKSGQFTAQGPEGTTLTWTDPANAQNSIKYSTASTILTSGNSSVIVSVLDTCYVQYLSAGWATRTTFNGTQGFLKQTTVAGYPAWEQFDAESSTYALNVLVKDRVLVTVQGTEGASEADIKAVAEALDYNKIATASST